MNIERVLEFTVDKQTLALREKFKPKARKKTLVFCNIDGLFLFSSHAVVARNFDRTIK